jgi:putative protein-disulfide isomerase
MTDAIRPVPEEAARKRFVYFADPMCSWCYGFSPVIEALARRFADRMDTVLVMGGLRAFNTVPMRSQDRDYIRGAWTRVGEASGQPFDTAFFDRETFVYDTEPACRAVVTVRGLEPAKALGYMSAVQRAFYAANRDVTQGEVLAEVASDCGLDRDAFELAFLSAEARNATLGDFQLAQECGISGFPALLAGHPASGYLLVTSGFRRLAELEQPLEDWWAAGASVG